MRFYFSVSDPSICQYVCLDKDIVPFIDLETLGKQERQGHLPTWKSKQTVEDISVIKASSKDNPILVRIDPINPFSHLQIDDVIARGADIIMLPMFKTVSDYEQFGNLVNGRAELLPLFETSSSLDILPMIIDKYAPVHAHIGLNDLHLDMGYDFLFEPLVRGDLEKPCQLLNQSNVSFGIGGIARASEGVIPPELLLGEHVRLGSESVILSQTFHRNAQNLKDLTDNFDFHEELHKLKSIFGNFSVTGLANLEKNRLLIKDRTLDVVNHIRSKKHQIR